MRERAQHPAQRVPELAVGVDGRLHDGGAETDIACGVGRGHPKAQDVGAGGLHHILGRQRVALRLRHLLLALLVEDEAVGQHDVVGRARTRAAQFQKRGLEPAAVLVGALQIHDLILAAVALALDAGEPGEVLGIVEHEGMRRSGIEPNVEDVAHLLPGGRIVDEAVEKALFGAFGKPHVGALVGEGVGDALDQLLRLGELGRGDHLAGLGIAEHGDRHAPGALARDDPVGTPFDHAADAVLAQIPAPTRSRRWP